MATSPYFHTPDSSTASCGQMESKPYMLQMELHVGSISGGRFVYFDNNSYDLVETFLSKNLRRKEINDVFSHHGNCTVYDFQRVTLIADGKHYRSITLALEFQTDEDLEHFYQTWRSGAFGISLKDAFQRCDFSRYICRPATLVDVIPIVNDEEYKGGKTHFFLQNLTYQLKSQSTHQSQMFPMQQSSQGIHNYTPVTITGPPTTSYAQVLQQSCDQGQTTENSLASSQSRQEELPSRSPTGQLHEITDVPDEPTRIAEQRDKPPKINEDSNVSFEDSWPPTVLHKQFIIQIPDVVGQLEGVVLKSDLPELSDTNLHQIEENSNIWTSYEIPVPINKEEICYSYEIKCKVGWKHLWKNKVVTESSTRKVRPCIKQRDVFILPDISKSAQRQDQFNGKLCLFENMLADRTETKQCLIECEEMDFPGNLSREESGELCKWTMHFIEKHEKHKYSTGKILVAYLVAVRSLKYSQSSRKLLDNRSAMLIIGKLKSCTVADIPESYMGMVERLAVELCQLAFSNKSTLLHLIDNFNHLLGMETIINIISSRGGEFCSPFDTTENKKLFETVMSRLTASDVAPRHLKCLFEKLISQCVSPLDLLFFKDECIGWSCDESLINDCMKLTRTRMVIALKEFTKQNYSPEKLKEVFNLWCKVRDDDMICNPEIQCIFEDSIFRKLQSQRVADTIWKDDTAEKLQAFIMESKVFLCEEKGYDMLLLLSKSKHQCLHALVPSILATDKFTRLSQDKLEKVTQTWLKMASEHHSKTKAGPLSKPSDRILYIYQYLLQAIEVPSVKTCVTMTEDLEAFVKGIIRQIGISSVLDKAHKMDNFPDHAQSLFREHVKDIIRADSSDSGASLETIIKGLKGSDMHLYINRSSEEILLTLLDIIEMPTQELSGTDGGETWMRFILQNQKFWYHILTARGPKVSSVHDHKACKQVLLALQGILESILSQSISLKSFDHLLKLFDQVGKSECFELLAASVPNCKKEKVVKSVEECRKRIDERWEQVQHLKRLVKRVLDPASEHCHFSNIEELKKIIEKCAKQLQKETDVSLKDIGLKSFWGTFGGLCEFAKVIYSYLKSTVFVKICISLTNSATDNQSVVPHNQDQLDTDVLTGMLYDDDDPFSESGGPLDEYNPAVQETDLESFVRLIAEQGIEKYASTFKSFFADEDILLGDVEQIFEGSDPLTECELIGKLQTRRFPETVIHRLHNFRASGTVAESVKCMELVLAAFDVSIKESSRFGRAIVNFRKYLCDPRKISLFELSAAVDMVQDVSKAFNETNTWNVITELSKSQALLEFLREVVDEDIRNLIDAVEEHSEQFVSEYTVSELIAVKRFIQPLLKLESAFLTQPERFFHTLQRCVKDGPKDISGKLHSCMDHLHSLKALYANVANRGEMTKEIIRNVLQVGRFKFDLYGENFCQATVFYKKHKKTTQFGINELNDLRSRALLLVNAEKPKLSKEDNVNAPMKQLDLERFISAVDSAYEISAVCTQLHISGHFRYRQFKRNKLEISQLDKTLQGLKKDLNDWNEHLQKARDECYYLNFIHADQLWTLHDYFTKNMGDSTYEQALGILSFICPATKVTDDFVSGVTPFESHDKPHQTLMEIGKALESLFMFSQPISRPICGVPQGTKKKIATMDSMVQPGQLYVATLDRESRQVVPVVLELYVSTTGFYPEPHQILFANQSTSRDEIQLFLRRCMKSGSLGRPSLYCMANVEVLPGELQFYLVDEIQSYMQKDGTCKNDKFLLAIICRGGEHHALVDQFSDFSHKIMGMQDGMLRECLSNLDRAVTVVTSEVPGLGKTEEILQKAASAGQGVITFPISGPFKRDVIVKRLVRTNMNKNQALHLSLDAVDDPRALDEFIFELLVIGTVKAGTTLFHMATNSTFIEVGNTIGDHLVNSLHTVMCFNRIALQWRNYANLQVSEEIASPVQVVCHYLKALDEASLDTQDIIFHGQQAPKPLPKSICQHLLEKYFSSNPDMSFAVLDIFMNVLSDQLKKLSASFFFKASSLDAMLGVDIPQTVRSSLVKALIDVSKEFSARSISTCREQQSSALSQMELIQNLQGEKEKAADTTSCMLERADGMIRWNDSNHLLVLFHSLDFQTISVLYRSLEKVPPRIKELFQTQARKSLPEMTDLSQKQLSDMLEKIARTKSNFPQGEVLNDEAEMYALTPDNLLKMALVIMRVRAGIPVIIMGETGCGKTSLIKYLAMTCGVYFEPFNIHAGIEEQNIYDTIMNLDQKAADDPENSYWLFLDEINTSQYLGFLSEIICHKSCRGQPLSPNLVCIAACNPYRQREKHQIYSAGLKGKVKTDPQSKLVYRVYPLPENMIDYVWDYGTLDPRDEEDYISRMVGDINSTKQKKIVRVIVESQKFMRTTEHSDWCVSLRDVHRCKLLIKWFMENLPKKTNASPKNINMWSFPKAAATSSSVHQPLEVKAIILALAHCYYVRLCNTDDREKYVDLVAAELGITAATVFDIIRGEQEDLLDRMELPEGTAKNTALRENVFVILISILNHIPIFVVGKPGCSKSLSMQLIRSNLRGKDSRDPFFKELPQLYVVSYQGSESSTSEGIEKVFDKAKNYSKHNPGSDVLPVVLLDEVGLAEISQHNPLKVLHSLLEPAHGKFPDVAVVGISNWALDAAKMNRAIHLSRPDLDEKELYETALSISGSIAGAQPNEHLKTLAAAYHHYQKLQKHQNFHGLRDYYSLIKYVTASEGETVEDDWETVYWNETPKRIKMGLLRNFGGLPSERNDIVNIFTEKLGAGCKLNVNVDDLVRQNLKDKLARHLMLITNGDAAVGILERSLKKLDRECEVIFGSQFEEDQQEEYNYRILSRIILCMERGVILILRDLENIYGSLYDMLNQNYTIVGNKRNCRIALGAYSNPMCHVHQDFRCIVLVDQSKVDYSDPPFLNRFEKQLLRFGDVLSRHQEEVIKDLEKWVDNISTIQGLQFKVEDVFAGFYQDTLASLVAKHCQSEDELSNSREVLERCKRKLLLVGTPQGIFRATKSTLGKCKQQEVKKVQEMYFQYPLHDGFQSFLETILAIQEEHESTLLQDAWDNGPGFKAFVMTHRNIHAPVQLGPPFDCLSIKLGVFKSEKQLTTRIKKYLFEDKEDLLILQCQQTTDAAYMLLAKTIIDNCRQEYMQQSTVSTLKKHICILVHMDHSSSESGWQFNFLSGWLLAYLDNLDKPNSELSALLGKSIVDILQAGDVSLSDTIKQNLLWAISTPITYAGEQPSLDSVTNIICSVCKSKELMSCFEEAILDWLTENGYSESPSEFDSNAWQLDVVCDKQALVNSSSLQEALQRHVKQRLSWPLAMVVYRLECSSAWASFLSYQSDNEVDVQKRAIWKELFRNPDILPISQLQLPLQSGCYVCNFQQMHLKFPFSKVLFSRLEQVESLFQDDLKALHEDMDNFDENNVMKDKVLQWQQLRFQPAILRCLCEVRDDIDACYSDLLEDFCNLNSSQLAPSLEEQTRVQIMKSLLLHQIEENTDDDRESALTRVVLTYWRKKELIDSILQLLSSVQDILGDDNSFLTEIFDSFEQQSQTNVEDSSQPTHYPEDGLMDKHVSDMPSYITAESGNIDVNNAHALEECIASDTSETLDHTEEKSHTVQQPIEDSPQTDKHVSDMPSYITAESGNIDVNNAHALEECIASDTSETLDHTEEKSHTVQQPIEDSPQTDENGALQAEHGAGFDEKDIVSDPDSVDTEHDASVCEVDYVDDTKVSTGSRDMEIKPLEQLIVEHVCKRILPTKTVLQLYDGAVQWQYRINILLQLSSKVMSQSETGEYPSVLHYLRVCSDYVNVLLIPHKLSDDFIFMEEIHDAEDIMESTELFQQVLYKMHILHLEKQVPANKLELFICLYFGRILDANIDTDLFSAIFQTVSRGEMPDENLCHFGPVLQRILQAEDEDGSLLLKIIDGDEQQVFQESVRLKQLNDVLKTNFEKYGWDSSLVALVTDTVASMYFEKSFRVCGDENVPNDLEMQKIFSARDHIIAANETTLQLVTSVAFVKSFLCSTDQEIENILEGKANSKFLMDNVSALTRCISDVECNERSTIFVRFLLKQLRQKHSIEGICHICKGASESFTSLKKVVMDWEPLNTLPRIGYNPFATAEYYHEAKLAVTSAVVKKETNLLDAFLGSARNSSAHQISLLGIVFETFYVVRASRYLTDDENSTAKDIAEKLQHYPEQVSILLKNLLGICDFGCKHLHISTESSDQHVLQATFIIHWLSLLFTTKKKASSFFGCIATDASVVSKTYTPAHPDVGKKKKRYQFWKSLAIETSPVHVFECKCWNSVCFLRSATITSRCPRCHRELSAAKENKCDILVTQNGSYESPDDKEVIKALDCVRGLSPLAHRVCNLLFQSCCLYSSSVADSSNEEPSTLIDFKECWSQLKILIEAEDGDLATFLHVVLLAEQSVLNQAECDTLESRDKWEDVFTEKCAILLKDWREKCRTFKIQCYEKMGIPQDCMETQVEEASNQLKVDMHLPRLFKLTSPATFQLFEANVANQQLDEAYPLLALFLQWYSSLTLLRHLPGLLDWHKTVTRLQNRQLKRKHAKESLICDILASGGKTEKSAEEQEKNMKYFEAFQESWNKLREHTELLKQLGLETSLIRMHDQLPIAEVLIDDQDSPIYQVICKLKQLQNHFLGEVQMLSVTKHCPALRFLNHGPGLSIIKEIPVQDATLQDVICLEMTDEWLKELLKHAQCDTRYGLGKMVHFDYDKIEMELGNELVLGKSILVMDSTFPMFQYSGELFFTSENILHDIRKNIPQESLSSDICNGVKQKQETSPRNARDLLTNLEVVVCLLKRTGGSPEQSLVEYTDHWLSMLPAPFPKDLLPSPPDIVKLCHIVSLYEMVEDLLTTTAITALPDEFRVKLSPDQMKELNPLLKTKDLNLGDFTTAVRKFIFRYTSSTEQSSCADPSKPLVSYLSSTTLWPEGTFINKKIAKTLGEENPKDLKFYIPESLKVQHVYAILAYIEETVKQMRDKESKCQPTVRPKTKRQKKLFSKT